MKKILLLLIGSALFALTSMARADDLIQDVKVSVEVVEYDEAASVISVSGTLPTRCAASPRPSLMMSPRENVLVLGVIATQHSSICANVIGGHYELAFDVRSLKYNIQSLGLNPEGTYIISTANGFSIEINFSENPFHISYSSTRLIGTVYTVEKDGQAMIALNPSQEEAIMVRSPFIDLTPFLGKTVEIQGHAVKARMNMRSQEPGRGENVLQKTVLVTGINTTSL